MYVTLAEAKLLIKRIINVYEEDNVVDDSHLQLVIDESEGIVNSSIVDRYDIPITDTNSIAFLRALVIPILRMKSYTQFAESDETPDAVQKEYDATMKIVEKLSKQLMSLPGQSEKTTGRPSYIKRSEAAADVNTGF
jgi:phage gp36-like protein